MARAHVVIVHDWGTPERNSQEQPPSTCFCPTCSIIDMPGRKKQSLIFIYYCTAIVTLFDAMPPMLSTSATLLPEGAPAGITAFT